MYILHIVIPSTVWRVVVLHTVEEITIKEECIKNEIDYYG
jgi:hypothetical protein